MRRQIAMKCTQEQFDSIKDILIRSGVRKVEYDDYYEYIFIDEDFEFDQINEISVEFMDAEVHEEWNAQIFLEACGIEVSNVGRYDIYQEIGALMDKAKKQGINIKIIIE